MSIKKSHLDFINFLKLNNKKPSYEKNPEMKPSMNNVNLYEKNTDEEIYNWKSLFNPSIPMYKYTHIKKPAKKKIIMIDEETQKNDEDLKKFPNPVLLVDLDNKNFKKFFKKETSFKENDVNLLKCKNINNNNINKKESFYFSNFFNDYYKENLKTFVKKFPLLKAKFETNSDKLKKSLRDRKSENKERKLNDIINSDNLKIKKQELIIAGKSDNPFPLLKSIYKQIHNIDYKDSNKFLKKNNNLQTNYVHNNNNKNITFKKNNHSYVDPLHEINEITQLDCSTYNENDPDLNIFKEKNYFSRNLSYANNNNIKSENISSLDNNLTTTISTNNSKPIIKNNLKRPFTSRMIKNNLKLINNDGRPLTTNNNKNSNDFNKNNNNLKTVESFKNDSFPIKINNNNQTKINKNINKIKEKKNLISDIKIEFDSYDKNKIKQRPLTNYKNKNNDNIYNENKNNNKKNVSKTEFNKKKEEYNFNYTNYYFNDYIDTIFNKDPFKKKISDECGYFYPLNLYNKNNQKWYNASNNIYVRNKKPFLNLNTVNYNNYKKNMDNNGLIIKPNINVLSSNRVSSKRRLYSAF